MNIKITSFFNPFSFFCVTDDLSEYKKFKFDEHDHCFSNTNKITDIDHGQYVAVLWKNKWVRGIISTENQSLVWLIDDGIFVSLNNEICLQDLPPEYRKLPSKVFEAGIHGVLPVDKVLTDDCQIKNEATTKWTQGAIEKSQFLLSNAQKIVFQPIALLATKHNDIVLGDLFLEIEEKGIVNLAEELNIWPIFLERNPEAYITNISKLYITRRHHHMCLMKPVLSGHNIPTINLQISFQQYEDILSKFPKRDTLFEMKSSSEDSSTIIGTTETEISSYKITSADIEKYSNSYIMLNGREYNVLSMLINKARDLSICERYKDHDLKSIGRGTSYRKLKFI